MGRKVVFFKFETTGYNHRKDEILQIGAVFLHPGPGGRPKIYDRYNFPTQVLDFPHATRFHGIEHYSCYDWDECDYYCEGRGHLILNDEDLENVLDDDEDNLRTFANWLIENGGSEVDLVSHSHFSITFMKRLTSRYMVEMPSDLRYQDTLPIFREILPTNSSGLKDVFGHYLGKERAHDALLDSKSLRNCCYLASKQNGQTARQFLNLD